MKAHIIETNRKYEALTISSKMETGKNLFESATKTMIILVMQAALSDQKQEQSSIQKVSVMTINKQWILHLILEYKT